MTFVRHHMMTSTAENAGALRDTLASLRTAVLACAGCPRVDLLRQADQPGRFFFIEHWASKADHAAAAGALPPEIMTRLKSLLAAPPVATDLVDDGSPPR